MPSRNACRPLARTWAHLLILTLLLFVACPAPSAYAAPATTRARGGPSPTFSDLIYGTYLGGTAYESYPSVGVDAAGNAYIAASTYSKDFPGFVYGAASSEMLAVASISPDGRRLNYAGTISGARGTQLSQAIAVAPDGVAYITGMTNAKDFPVTPDNGAMPCGRNNDVFLVILDPTGGLRYSGCWGGSGWDQPLDIALAPDGDVIIAGYTFSRDFPTTPSAFQSDYVDLYDAFVLRLHASAPGQADAGPGELLVESSARLARTARSPADALAAPKSAGAGATLAAAGEKWTLVAATLLGGYGDDRAYDVDVAPDGSVLVSGQAGDNFPVTAGAYQTDRGASINPDAFVTHLAPDLTSARFSTYLGGVAADYAKAAVFAPDGIVVAGLAKSALPVSEGAYDATGDAVDGDVFIAKLDPTGSRLLRSTYVGRAGQDEPSSLLVDDAGFVTLSGVSQFAFPTTSGSFDPTYNGLSETWLCRLDPDLRDLTYSTLVGGSGLDGMRSFQGNTMRAPVARLPGDPAHPGRFSPDDSYTLATITFSKDWPVSGTSFQSKLNYQWDLGIARLRMGELRAIHAAAAPEIDGVFTGWRGLPGLVLNSRNAAEMTLRPPRGAAPPVAPSLADVSGRLQMQWNGDALYFAATIADNDALVPVGFPSDAGADSGGGDALELTVEVLGKTRTFAYPSLATAQTSAFARTPGGWAVEAVVSAESLGLPPGGLVSGEMVRITWTILDEDTGQPSQSLAVTTKVTL